MKFTTITSCYPPDLKMISETSCLNLAHQNLKTVPRTLINCYHSTVKIIDISNNNISDVSFLSSFSNLSCIILDHNDLTSDTVFPFLPGVKVLWANHNKVESLSTFVNNLAESFPSLQQLSLMGNPGVPPCHEDTFYGYLRYRLYVIYRLKNLEHLDDRPVTDHEKEEARRLFGSPLLFDKFSSITDVFSDALNKVRQYISPPGNDRPNIII